MLLPLVSGAIRASWLLLTKSDSTITTTLSSTIADEFQSLTIIPWLGAGYLIGVAATQPLTGKFSDIFGRKASFGFATLVFTAGNLACGLARSRAMLILGRVIAGIGGGACNSITTFISSDHIPPRYRGIWHSIGILVFTVGMGCGAVAGGGINDALGWRWAFIMLAPISVCAGIGVNVFLPQSTAENASLRQQLGRIDYGGSVTLVSSLALLLIYLNQEESQAAALLPPAGLCLALFIMIELRWAEEPIIPLTLFATPTVLAACLCIWFMSTTVYTLMYYVPLYLQLRGHSTSRTGFLMLPESVGGGLGSLAVGFVTRLSGRYGTCKTVLPFLTALSSAGFMTISINSPSIAPEIYLFLYGLGYGGLLTVLLVALLRTVPQKLQAPSTSLLYAFRSIGSTIGLSAAGVIFRSRLNKQTLSCGEQDHVVSPNSTVSCLPLHQFDHQDGRGLSREVYMYALRGTFQLAFGFAIAGLISTVFIKSYKLRSTLEDRDNSVAQGQNNGNHGPGSV